jgi:hypothetical protein
MPPASKWGWKGKNMSDAMKPTFETTPETHASRNGHWDRVKVEDPGGKAMLSIDFQNGPVKEFGVNGVQLTDVLKICLARYQMLNVSFPCRENSIVITKLQEAIMWDEERTAKRTKQGVEGYDRPHVEETGA